MLCGQGEVLFDQASLIFLHQIEVQTRTPPRQSQGLKAANGVVRGNTRVNDTFAYCCKLNAFSSLKSGDSTTVFESSCSGVSLKLVRELVEFERRYVELFAFPVLRSEGVLLLKLRIRVESYLWVLTEGLTCLSLRVCASMFFFWSQRLILR